MPDPFAARPRRVPLRDHPAPIVRQFRDRLDDALSAHDDAGRVIANAKWGVYAFFDYDGEPIYVGQTNEQLRVRVRRHLTNQRTDAVAMRILDVFEVAELELWPLWELQAAPSNDRDAKRRLDECEYSAYVHAIEQSRFHAILNEKIPPMSRVATLPVSHRFPLVSDAARDERGHPDTRIARRSETIGRLAAVAHERGEVSAGLRRVLVIQAVRLAYLAAVRLAEVEGRDAPPPSVISTPALVGDVLRETGPTEEQLELELEAGE